LLLQLGGQSRPADQFKPSHNQKRHSCFLNGRWAARVCKVGQNKPGYGQAGSFGFARIAGSGSLTGTPVAGRQANGIIFLIFFFLKTNYLGSVCKKMLTFLKPPFLVGAYHTPVSPAKVNARPVSALAWGLARF
jgi:hypothetical protein